MNELSRELEAAELLGPAEVGLVRAIWGPGKLLSEVVAEVYGGPTALRAARTTELLMVREEDDRKRLAEDQTRSAIGVTPEELARERIAQGRRP